LLISFFLSLLISAEVATNIRKNRTSTKNTKHIDFKSLFGLSVAEIVYFLKFMIGF